MKHLTFQTRLIIGFSVILFFSFTIGIVSIVQIKTISSGTESIYKHPLTVSNSVRDINSNINVIHRLMTNILLTEAPEQLTKSIAQINSHNKLIHDAFTLISNRFLGHKSIVDNAHASYEKWEKIRDEIIELKKAGEDSKVLDLIKGKSTAQVQVLFEQTKVLSDFTQSKADEFYLHTTNSSKKSIFILIATISALLLLSIATAIYISRSISKPIHKFINEIGLLYQKERPVTKLHTKSEQEILINASKELKEVYKKLKEFNKELDKKIEERTQELHIAKERAEESDRLKSAFLANMSHEIRTPMNSILGFSELLKHNNLSKEKQEQYIDLINTGGKRLLSIISDIVDISRIQSNELLLNNNECYLNHIIDDLYQEFSTLINTRYLNLKQYKGLNDIESYIYTDETHLTQILSNLLRNANNFTEKGSIEFGYEQKDDQLLFFVKDTGVGISEKDQKFIFERFRKTDYGYQNAITGTGLGLAIAKGLVELFNGKIWVYSELGAGSVFYFSIPYLPVEKKEIPESRQPDTDPDSENNPTTILIAEDEQSNFVYLKELLSQSEFDYTIIHAQNGKEAVDFVKKNNTIDLILMDIKMPVMNGLDATREIRKINPKIPVVAQTAHAMTNDKKIAMEAGCSDYLTKPIPSKLFSRIIRKHLNKRKATSL